jgi:probable selenium-dependent hydroxylase accessory protein YqeC
LTLVEALGAADDDVVALVGGGEKTTATHIFASQIALAPAHVMAADATAETISAALAVHRHVLVIGDTNHDTRRSAGVSLDVFGRLRSWCPRACLLNEADGSRMRPFKAPADHEPAIPVDTTLVVPVVGADIFGKTLDAEHVHRPELVSALSGRPVGAPITPEIVAQTLAHPDGGCRNVPARARETAEQLLTASTIESVVLAGVRGDEPVLEVCTRRKLETAPGAR